MRSPCGSAEGWVIPRHQQEVVYLMIVAHGCRIQEQSGSIPLCETAPPETFSNEVIENVDLFVPKIKLTYSKWRIHVGGNTNPIRNFLNELGGGYVKARKGRNTRINGPSGWQFAYTRKDEITRALIEHGCIVLEKIDESLPTDWSIVHEAKYIKGTSSDQEASASTDTVLNENDSRAT
jgi:hypothetical protein